MTTPAAPRTLADKLNHLFQTVHPRGRGPYSNEEVATAIRDTGESVSATYLWLLRRGERTNPTMRHLQALAGFFGVAPAYFFDDAVTRRTDRDLELLSSLRQLGVKRVALRAVLESAGLSEASQRMVQQVVDRCLELEGLSGAESSAYDAETSAYHAESSAYDAETGAFDAETGSFDAESGAFGAESDAFGAEIGADPVQPAAEAVDPPVERP